MRRELDDLLGRAVADLERLDVGRLQAEVVEHAAPVREAVVHVQALRDVAGERDALLRGDGVEHDGHLDGREVLRLVDQDVLVLQRLLAPAARGPARRA